MTRVVNTVDAEIGAVGRYVPCCDECASKDSFWTRTADVLRGWLDAFKESEHPRGQPENAGEFAKGAGNKTPATAHLKEAGPDREKWPEHIKAMKIPPAWTDVWVSPDHNTPLQAQGTDAAGRRQPIYLASYLHSNSMAKYARITELDQQVAAITQKNRQNQKSKDPVVREHADVTALIIEMGVRPGSEGDTKAKVQAYGATTLKGSHVVPLIRGTRLRFTGKKGVKLDLKVEDPGIAKMLQDRAKAAGNTGQLFPHVSANSLRDYVHQFGDFHTKDFRTLLGTKTAQAEVANMPAPQNPAQYKKAVHEVAKVVAAKLGNTPAVVLSAYINPVIFGDWQNAAPKPEPVAKAA